MSSAAIAFATLFLMMGAHAILESARDALLLGSLSPKALLWSYVAIAVIAVGLTRRGPRREPMPLATMLLYGTGITLGFWALLPRVMPYGAIAFYVFTGIFATLIVPRFWLLLTSQFTVRQAKRHYATIGLGGVAGAGAGSAMAAAMLAHLSARGLLVVGAVAYAVAGAVAHRLGHVPVAPKPVRARAASSSEPRAYLKRLAWLAVIASAALTVIDYLFKSVTAATVPSAELGAYFARTYAVMNVVALVVQLLVVPRLLRVLGTHTAAAVLPGMLLAGTGTFVLFGAPFLVLAAKGSDGALRNSLHRITLELFYFPLSDEARNRWKAATDAFGQRGGQAFGALAILGLLAAGAGSRVVAILAAGLALAWVILALLLRRPYVQLFREGLRRGAMHYQISALGSDTLQAVMEAFSSPDDGVVCSALDFLAQHGNARLIPSVMVHHPSRTVALRALDLLASAHRVDLPHIVGTLVDHPDVAIRARALRARMQAGAGEDELLAALEDASIDVRATAMVSLFARPPHRERARGLLEAIVAGEDVTAKLALARALHAEPAPELGALLPRLLRTNDLAVRREVLRVMAQLPDRSYLALLRPLLGHRRLLVEVRAAVLASSFGDSSVVEEWLRDESLPRTVRRHVPRTLSAFGTAQAANALAARLTAEPDGAVRFKVLRGLGGLRAQHPEIAVDEPRLLRLAEENLDRAIQILAWRVALGTPTGRIDGLLVALLRNKEEHALERVFRLLGILQPEAELEGVWRSIQSDDAQARDVALELVEQMPASIRGRLVAMLQPRSEAARLRAAGAAMPSREGALREMERDKATALVELARTIVHGQ